LDAHKFGRSPRWLSRVALNIELALELKIDFYALLQSFAVICRDERGFGTLELILHSLDQLFEELVVLFVGDLDTIP
jgi:hypothetical protein